MPPGTTYLTYLAATVLAPAAALWAVVAWRRDELVGRAIGVLAVTMIAVTYTTPWDARLIRIGVWWYGDGVVTARMGAVPLGEYCFFILQPILTGAVLHLVLPDVPDLEPRRDAARGVGLAAFSVLALVGWGLRTTGWGFYLGWILVWACPVVAFLFGVVGDILWRVRGRLLVVLGVSTAYLWLVDWYAITNGYWTIAPSLSTGVVVTGLPIEESVFFLVTNALVVAGVVGYEWVRARSVRVGLTAGVLGLAPLATHGRVHERNVRELAEVSERPEN